MLRSAWLFFVVAWAAAVGPADVAWAQKKPPGFPGKPGKGRDKDRELRIEGTIKQVAADGWLVEGDDGERYWIGLTNLTEATVSGAASKAFLGPGACVEFEAALDRSGKALEEVRTLTFVELDARNPPGIFATELEGETGSDATDDRRYVVRGKMAPPRDGMLIVPTGKKTVTARVAADAKLLARLSDWQYASAGDSVKATVEAPPQPQTGVVRVVARRVKVEAAEPLRPRKK